MVNGLQLLIFYFELFCCSHYFIVKNETKKRNKRNLGFQVDLEPGQKNMIGFKIDSRENMVGSKFIITRAGSRCGPYLI